MTETELRDHYFVWMCQRISDDRYDCSEYQQLLAYLHQIPFTYTIPMDCNREADGIDLRYRFGEECGYSCREVAVWLDCKPCSILEMMVALASICEIHIMSDPELGDRTGVWFWTMIDNLGLLDMDNERFDKRSVDRVIARLLNRTYEPNGKGGLFTVPNCKYDLRTVDIWYQMCWYLDSILQ